MQIFVLKELEEDCSFGLPVANHPVCRDPCRLSHMCHPSKAHGFSPIWWVSSSLFPSKVSFFQYWGYDWHIFAVHWPKLIDFEDPESEGLSGARNFYLKTDKNVEVGVWRILPKDLIHLSQNKDRFVTLANIIHLQKHRLETKTISMNPLRSWYEEQLSNGSPIVIYMHGNTGKNLHHLCSSPIIL